ncbi:phospholipase A, partial [Acinetobacter sp.]
MAFIHFERTALQLGILLSVMAAASASAQTNPAAPTPATPEACVALASNADRLACYDALYKIPQEVKPALVSERMAAQELKPEPTEKLTFKEKVSHAFSERLFAVEAPQLNPNLSMLDRRWELSQDSKLGTWNIRGYQPVYLMPGYWTSDKNERPSSPNPSNTVQPDQEQQLKSM